MEASWEVDQAHLGPSWADEGLVEGPWGDPQAVVLEPFVVANAEVLLEVLSPKI